MTRAEATRLRLEAVDCLGVLREAEEWSHLPGEVILSPSREAHVADARARVVYEVADRLHLSTAATARLFGVDRTTVRCAQRRWARIVGEPEVRHG